jgi:thiamine pyrophosphate-dependent acetolactate synthase large subunit-like protein
MGTDLEQVARACGIQKTATVSNEEDLDETVQSALSSDGPWFIVAKIQEAGYMAVAPIEPEVTLHRMRESFLGPAKAAGH